MKTTASILSEQMRAADGKDLRDGNPGAIYALIDDGGHTHCMTEGMLDAWWESLSPADKAEIHERWLDAEAELDPGEGYPAIEAALRAMRHPLDTIYAAAEQLAARSEAQPNAPYELPMFCGTEIGMLRRQPCTERKS